MPDKEHTYTLTFRVPVSIFTGLGIAGLVDRTVVRDADSLPYIPGSSVKGRLRFFAERLLRTGTPPSGYRMCALHEPICKFVDAACTICRLFGNPSIPALVRIGQASLVPPWDDLFAQLLKANRNPVVYPDVEIRPGIALSRSRRVALANHLFFDEAVPAITFRGRLFLDHRVIPQETSFLVQVGTLVDALGARKVAGRGSLEGGIRIVAGRS
jgi:CRISPR/Cas system CSM-associated protein Csm3 (group 7 of RAMP superfamily)